MCMYNQIRILGNLTLVKLRLMTSMISRESYKILTVTELNQTMCKYNRSKQIRNPGNVTLAKLSQLSNGLMTIMNPREFYKILTGSKLNPTMCKYNQIRILGNLSLVKLSQLSN